MNKVCLIPAGVTVFLLACLPALAPAQDALPAPRTDGKDAPGKSRPRPRKSALDPAREKELNDKVEKQLPPNPPSILVGKVNAIDLASALKLAGVDNPEILLARQRVVEGIALWQRAAAMILPNLNYGLNYDAHQGTLQQSSGNILRVNRDALYAGMGANAVAAGTVNIPGLQYNLNVSDAIFGALLSRQQVRVREFQSEAVFNEVLLRVAEAYMDLLRAEGHRVIAIKNRDQIREIARLTTVYAIAGENKQSDADRAVTELGKRNDLVLEAENEVLLASAALARLLNLDPSCILFAVDGWVVPAPIVPDPLPLCQLIVTAINQRPELAARRATIRQATLALSASKWLPFSPNAIVGYSNGTFGGGSNLVAQPQGFLGFKEPRFDSFADRQDFDVVLFWTAQNLGLGNLAMVRVAQSNVQSRNLEFIRTLNTVRSEVASGYARTHARFAQIDIGERAVKSGESGYQADFERITLGQGLPIELIDSFRLLSDARYRYLDAITLYNRAHFELYVALGRPPAALLAQPIPARLVPPPLQVPAPGMPPAPVGFVPPAVLPGLPLEKGKAK